jgi:hypothetical protein
MNFIEYVLVHAQRGSCTCGQCIDAPDISVQPIGHTVDLTFFKVAAKGGNKSEFLRLAREEFPGWFDGKEHSYIELGAQMGDQGIALMAIGLGDILGAWKALSPDTITPFLPADLKQTMAGAGLVAMQVVPE